MKQYRKLKKKINTKRPLEERFDLEKEKIQKIFLNLSLPILISTPDLHIHTQYTLYVHN